MSDSMSGMGGKLGKMKSQQSAMRALLVVALGHIQDEDSFGGPTFSGLDLTGVSLEGLDFANATFRGCNLSWVNFADCDLSWALFDECILTGAKFRGARMEGLALVGVVCEFSCDLSGARFGDEETAADIKRILTK